MLSTGSAFLTTKPTAAPKHSGMYLSPLIYNAQKVFTDKGKSTRLPREILIVRIACCILLAAAFYHLSLWVWPIGCYVAWLLYTQYIRPDPLIQAMHDVAGGTKKFAGLPELEPSLFRTTSRNLDWDKLPSSLYRLKLSDGRKGLLVKANSSVPKTSIHGLCHKETIFLFVERLSPRDYLDFPYLKILQQILSLNWHNTNWSLINAKDSKKNGKPMSRNIFVVGQSLSLKTSLP